jgi:peptidoglycan/LPS O-acetylase OafA/YrhL
MKGMGSLANTYVLSPECVTSMTICRILSSPFWIPLSRINYAAYLVHCVVLTVFFSAEQTVRT